MCDEKLIEEVRKYPCLYDMAEKRYLDTKYKMGLWLKIAKQLNTTETIAKKRWTNIRDQFKRTLNKTKTVSGQAATAIKKYRFADQLEFLRPYFMERSTLSSINEDVTESASAPNSERETSPAPEPEAGPSSAPQFGRNLEMEHGTSGAVFRAPARGGLRAMRARHATTRPRPHHTADELFRLIQEREPKKQLDQIDDFCASLASTIRTFPPVLQNKAKGVLFAAVQKLELEHILGVSSSPIRDDTPRMCSSQQGEEFEEEVQQRHHDPIGFLDSPVSRTLSRIETSQECLAGSPSNTSDVSDTPEMSD